MYYTMLWDAARHDRGRAPDWRLTWDYAKNVGAGRFHRFERRQGRGLGVAVCACADWAERWTNEARG